jgi:hypothetical protein
MAPIDRSKYKEKNNIDVTIRTTGMSAIGEVFLGSVANNAIHQADMFDFVCCGIPTLLTKLEIKPKYSRREQGGMKNKRNSSLSY